MTLERGGGGVLIEAPSPLGHHSNHSRKRTSLDALLHEIYRVSDLRRRQSSVGESDTFSEGGATPGRSGGLSPALHGRSPNWGCRRQLLESKGGFFGGPRPLTGRREGSAKMHWGAQDMRPPSPFN